MLKSLESELDMRVPAEKLNGCASTNDNAKASEAIHSALSTRIHPRPLLAGFGDMSVGGVCELVSIAGIVIESAKIHFLTLFSKN